MKLQIMKFQAIKSRKRMDKLIDYISYLCLLLGAIKTVIMPGTMDEEIYTVLFMIFIVLFMIFNKLEKIYQISKIHRED